MKTILQFTKMQGLGNDFVVIDATRHPIELSTAQYRFIADRHFGIGCDQILLVEPAKKTGTDFHYRIFNADGGEVEQCGNGARCFAHYVRDCGLTRKDVINVSTYSGIITLTVLENGDIQVNMGKPILDPPAIPFTAPQETAPLYSIAVGEETLQIGAVSMGNPHAVLEVSNVDMANVEHYGPLLEAHPRFPQRVNVGFMEIRSPEHIRLRVYERGAGETLACGTGACAAVVVGRLRGILDERVSVDLPGGKLMVEWRGVGHPVGMSGPAARVYDGRIAL